MKGGNISNVAAASVILDADSLFDVRSFSITPVKKYYEKVMRVAREINITLFIDKGGKFKEKHLSGIKIPYTDTIVKDMFWMRRLLKKTGQYIFASEERAKLFQGSSYLLDATVKDIISQAK